MRINEIITESRRSNVDEGIGDITLGQIGRGVGKAIGGLGKVAGGTVGAAVGVGSAVKQGSKSGRDWVSGKGSSTTTRVEPKKAPTTTDTTQQEPSQTPTTPKPVNVTTLKQSIEKLSKKDQQAILKQLEKKIGKVQ